MSEKRSQKPHHDSENEAPSEALNYESLQQKLAEAEKKAAEHFDRSLRLQAEHENISRRASRDVAHAHKYALEKFVGELLPIVDSLELCVSNVPEKLPPAGEAVIEGVNLTLKMFYNALEKFGVKQVNPVDQPFNPELEQAISVQLDESKAPNTVLSVLQKGYTLNERLIRPALVVVSKTEE